MILQLLFPDQPDLQKKWWTSPNKSFDNKTPEAMFEQDAARVATYLLSHLGGDYS